MKDRKINVNGSLGNGWPRICQLEVVHVSPFRALVVSKMGEATANQTHWEASVGTFLPKHAASGSSWGPGLPAHSCFKHTEGSQRSFSASGLSLGAVACPGVPLDLPSQASCGQERMDEKLGRNRRQGLVLLPGTWEKKGDTAQPCSRPAPGSCRVHFWGMTALRQQASWAVRSPAQTPPGGVLRVLRTWKVELSMNARTPALRRKGLLGVSPGSDAACFAEGIVHITTGLMSMVSWPSAADLGSHSWACPLSIPHVPPISLDTSLISSTVSWGR